MKIRNTEFNFGERTYIMGILNVTPDSFSDGGKFNEIEAALMQVRKLVADGADIIDIGGESTRPGAKAVSIEEEINRVVPVIEAIRKEMDVVISIDTYNSATAEAAIKAGADIINDVWGFKKDEAMAKIAAKYNVPCILMHNRIAKPYVDLEKEFISDLKESINNLDSDLKIIVILYYYEDMSIKDISESLNIPQGTIKSRLSRARKRLKEILSINEEVL